MLGSSKQSEKNVMPAMHEYAISMARDVNLRRNISCYCAWTHAFAKYASENDWYRSEQIKVTGTPRMDFFAPQWHDAVRCMSSYVDTYPEPIILINSSFTLANPRFQKPDQEMEWMINKFSYDRMFVEKWRNTQDLALQGLVALANQLAKRFPQATFIYRPHPFEGQSVYEELLEPLLNLHLVKEGTVDGWLLRAKALIHWGSSTAIDACLTDVPVFTAGWLPVHLPVPAVDSVSIRCSTEAVLTEQLAAIFNEEFTQPPEIMANIEKVIEDTFYKIDGLAHQRVADVIFDVVTSTTSKVSIRYCRDIAYGIDPKSRKEQIMTAIRKNLGISVHWSFRQWKPILDELEWDVSDRLAEKHFNASDVQNIIEAIQENAPLNSDESNRKVHVMPTQEGRDYRFGYMQGRSVVIFAE
jgi:surface carbohydrate biosynthesis protein